MVFLGGANENQSLASNFQQLPPGHIVLNQPSSLKKGRHLSCFLQGFMTLMANLLNNIPIHLERWSSFPETPVDAFYACNSS
ncbi:transposase [Microcoleus sp. LEGE 07076]|nr:transposase [Microcoleus sp. LEGE 07076]